MGELQVSYRVPLLSYGEVLRTEPYIRGIAGNIIREQGVGLNLYIGSQVPKFSQYVFKNDALFFYLRANIERKNVDHNIFLEGNSKTENDVTIYSYGVVAEEDVTVASVGFVIGQSHFELGVDFNYESKIYKSQAFNLDGTKEFFDEDDIPEGEYWSTLSLNYKY